ncbi:MAG: hypothetical protein ACE5G2_07085 [Candidatus Krumholzibacteriia bacterium]
MTRSERRLLQAILTRPTAPFREHYVQAAIEATCRRLELPVRRDRFGNVYVSLRHGRARPLAFTAHMDHPGFEVLEGGNRARALLLGGVAPEAMQGAPVVFYADSAERRKRPPARLPDPVRGRIVDVHTRRDRGARRPQVRVDVELESAIGADGFGHFDFPGLEVEGDLLRSKALDNLLSCVMILAAMGRLRRRRAAANVLGVFTRAEEVGFVGAGGVLRSPQLPPGRPLVVLETSKALPTHPIGKGPALRVGDRMTCFDPQMDLWLTDRAAALAKRRKRFAYQRALMTGGACEASLYMLHGRRVGAIALPLGNYHNMTPDRGIGPEYVSARDFENALLLLEHLAGDPPDPHVTRSRRSDLDAVFTRLSPRLETP